MVPRNHYVTIESPIKKKVVIEAASGATECACSHGAHEGGWSKAADEPHRAGVKFGFD